MKWFIAPLLLVAFHSAQAKTLTVAVIDTGIDKNLPHLCKMGHKSFLQRLVKTSVRSYLVKPDPLVDSHGHGTHVAGLINQNASITDYCMVSMQYYSDTNSGSQNLMNVKAALRYAIDIGVDFINFSGGGPEPDEDEYLLIEEALNKGIVVVVAAGNEKSDLGKKCDYFPACYDKRLVIVGNLEITKDYRKLDDKWKEFIVALGYKAKLGTYETQIAPSSNYGTPVNRWEVGTDCKSNLPGGQEGYMSGTSQATAVATGKLLKEKLAKK